VFCKSPHSPIVIVIEKKSAFVHMRSTDGVSGSGAHCGDDAVLELCCSFPLIGRFRIYLSILITVFSLLVRGHLN